MAERKVTMRVFGMTCDDCVRTVSDGLKKEGAGRNREQRKHEEF